MKNNSKKKQENLYALLGVPKDAEAPAIKSAYKKLALKWHPDKNNGSEEATEKFKIISEAYAILSNPSRRKRYDLYGETGQDEGLDDMFSGGGMEDFFSQMFGAGTFGAGDMDMGDDFDEFINILEGDNMKSFSGLFGNLGRNYRGGGRGPKKNARA
jgi:DnaJ-class molecular chaperone